MIFVTKVTDVHAKENTTISDKAKDILKRHFKKLLVEKVFKDFNTELTKYESDPAKLEDDKVFFILIILMNK